MRLTIFVYLLLLLVINSINANLSIKNNRIYNIYRKHILNSSKVLNDDKEVHLIPIKSNTLTKSSAKRLLLLCTMTYGSNYIATKMLQTHIDAALLNALRFFIGSIYFIPDILTFRGTYIDINNSFIYHFFTTKHKLK